MRSSSHFAELVGAHFEGDRSIRGMVEYLAGEPLVVVDARLAHQGGVGSESADHRVGGQFQDPLEIPPRRRTPLSATHSPRPPAPSAAYPYLVSRIQLAASAIPVATAPGHGGEGFGIPTVDVDGSVHPARRPASTSRQRSPTMKLRSRSSLRSWAARRSRPGAGFRHRQPSATVVKQTMTPRTT